MQAPFVSSSIGPAEKIKPAHWFVLRKQSLLIVVKENTSTPPFVRDIRDIGLQPVREVYVGRLGKTDCYAVEVDERAEAPEGMEYQGFRNIHGTMDETIFNVAFRAMHIIDWDGKDQYCSRCGTKNMPKNDELAKKCPQCGFVSFPRISPAIIVLVEHEGKALLARSPRFKDGLFSTLAGFVEPGETLEDAVRREVKEEAGINVKNICYFGSQPWPFPDSLMVGFTAEYAGGELTVDNNEILDARWFTADNMPEIPGKISISRALIDWFVEKRKSEKTMQKRRKTGKL